MLLLLSIVGKINFTLRNAIFTLNLHFYVMIFFVLQSSQVEKNCVFALFPHKTLIFPIFQKPVRAPGLGRFFNLNIWVYIEVRRMMFKISYQAPTKHFTATAI